MLYNFQLKLFHICKNSGGYFKWTELVPHYVCDLCSNQWREIQDFLIIRIRIEEILIVSNQFLFNSIQSRFTEWVTESLEPGSVTLTFKHSNGDSCDPMEPYTARRHPNSRNVSTTSRTRPEFPRTNGYFRWTRSVRNNSLLDVPTTNYGAYERHTMTGFSGNDNVEYVLTLLSRPFSRKTVNYCSVYRRRRAKFQFRGMFPM